jgi:hypothetical protein
MSRKAKSKITKPVTKSIRLTASERVSEAL